MNSRTAPSSSRNDYRHPRHPARAHGYSLTEILVVIALIVILIAVAVPVLSVLSGNRSTEAAENQVAAMLNQARAQAIALQRNVGVAFFVDPATQRPTMALVAQVAPPYAPIERLPDYDFVALQAGTGVQFVNDDFSVTSPTAPRDRYVRIGCIMFDGRGQAISVPFEIRVDSALGQAMDLPRVLQTLGFNNAQFYHPKLPVGTQLGLVIYDNEAFGNQDFDPAEGIKTPLEAEENAWLDQNAVPYVVNRYNGTLIRGE
jgi:prepilin-type N-terminal cleavage/methylation domain-containing protein